MSCVSVGHAPYAWDREYEKGWEARQHSDLPTSRMPALPSTWRESPGNLVRWFLGEFARPIQTLAGRTDGRRVALSAGCGAGRSDRTLAELGLSVVGFDISLVALQQAASKDTGAHYIQSTLQALPFSDNSFAIVICNYSSAPYLTTRGDLEAHLSELSRIAMPEALVLVTSVGPEDSAYQSFPIVESDIPAIVRSDPRLRGIPTALWEPEELAAEYDRYGFDVAALTKHRARSRSSGKSDDAGVVFYRGAEGSSLVLPL